MSITEEKQLLRQKMREMRNELSEEDHQKLSMQICEQLAELPQIQQAEVIAAFHPMHHEVDILPLLEMLTSRGKKILIPDIKKANLQFAGVDLFLVPGLAFDLQKYRVGYGKGYYDQILKEVSNQTSTVGVAFDFQVVKEVPREAHDIPLRMIITEKRKI